MDTRLKILKDCQRLIVKVGTSTLTYPNGNFNFQQIEKLVRQLADLHNQGKDVILVSSGAVGAGLGRLGLKERPKTIPEKQAAAAVGQGILMHMYEKLFGEYGQKVAQVLLTKEDLTERKRFLNARNTLLTLLQYGVIPIVNENDTVAVDEIRFGDNDTLSSMVAGLVDGDLLILLSDIDGLYTMDPRKDPNAELISVIEEITPEIIAIAGGTGSSFASGGMATKIQAAKIAMSAGMAMVIANSSHDGIITGILQGKELGTLFLPKEGLTVRKRWIAYGSKVQGKIFIDEGAAKAVLGKGSSLLPKGITAVEGSFDVGNVVSVIDGNGLEIARGMVNYNARDLDKIKGVHTKEITKILGVKDYDEAIHRDNMALK